jgi:hypothetical protein
LAHILELCWWGSCDHLVPTSHQKDQLSFSLFKQLIFNRQIYKGAFADTFGEMTEQINKWWEGLAKELQIDIETLSE